MRITQFTIPGRFPGMNEIIAAGNAHRMVGAKMKKDWTKLASDCIMVFKVPVFIPPLKVKFLWIEPDMRRDLDNICAGAKFIMDAMVEMGRIPKDSQRYVKHLYHDFAVDKVNPRVQIEIIEMEIS